MHLGPRKRWSGPDTEVGPVTEVIPKSYKEGKKSGPEKSVPFSEVVQLPRWSFTEVLLYM